MKCIRCKEGTLELKMYDAGNRSYNSRTSKGVLQCNSCGHKEVFR